MDEAAISTVSGRLKVAHVVTVYRAVVGILDAKLGALAAYPDLDVSAYSAPNWSDEKLPTPKVKHTPIPMSRTLRPISDLVSIYRLYRAFLRDKPDVVHTHSAKAGVIGAVAAWMAGVKLVVHTHHGLPFYKGQPTLEHTLYRTLESVASRFRHHLLSQNRSDLPDCAKLMKSWHKVSFEGNGVDADEVVARAIEGRAEAEGDFDSFAPDAFRMVMLARLEPVKRVHDFISACQILAQRGVNFGAVVAGVGSLRNELQQQIDAAGVGARVKLVGWRDNAPALLAAGDAAVLTSEKEGAPRSLMEAMALSKPVVATDVSGTQELVQNERTGWLTPAGDPQALAAKLAELAEDGPLQRWFGMCGRRRVEKHFDERRVAEFLRDFYYERLGRPLPVAQVEVARARPASEANALLDERDAPSHFSIKHAA